MSVMQFTGKQFTSPDEQIQSNDKSLKLCHWNKYCTLNYFRVVLLCLKACVGFRFNSCSYERISCYFVHEKLQNAK